MKKMIEQLELEKFSKLFFLPIFKNIHALRKNAQLIFFTVSYWLTHYISTCYIDELPPDTTPPLIA